MYNNVGLTCFHNVPYCKTECRLRQHRESASYK